MTKYIFQLEDVRKVLEGGREVLRGLNLAFFYGAKIGVIGANGAGKSTLLRIMAGVEKDHEGTAFAAPGMRVGFLPQEPQLDPRKDVRGNVEVDPEGSVLRAVREARAEIEITLAQ